MINYEEWKWFRDHKNDPSTLTGPERDQFINATLAFIITALEPDGTVTQRPKESEIDLK